MINDNLTASERLKYFKFSSSWELLSPDNGGVGARRTGNGNALVGDQNPAAVDCVDGIELDFHLSLRCIEEKHIFG